MVQDSGLCTLPFIEAKCNEDNNAGDDRAEDASVCPRVEATAKVEADQEESETYGEEAEPRKIKMAQLLEDGEVVESSVSLRWSVAHKDAGSSHAPERHLNPL